MIESVALDFLLDAQTITPEKPAGTKQKTIGDPHCQKGVDDDLNVEVDLNL